jgi:hypothetical protein
VELDPAYGYGFTEALDPDTGKPVGLFRGLNGVPDDCIEIWDTENNTWRRVISYKRITSSWMEESISGRGYARLPGESAKLAFLRCYKGAAIQRLTEVLVTLRRIQMIEKQLEQFDD